MNNNNLALASACHDGSSDKLVSFKDLWQPRRIVSLWDMRQFSAQAFYLLGRILTLVNMFQKRRGRQPAYESEEERNEEINHVKDLKEKCSYIQFIFAERQCDHMIDMFSEGDSPTADQYAIEADYLSRQIESELALREFFILDATEIEFYSKNQFSETLQRQFPETIEDMIEFGRCYALGRYTASVFHLMRLMEGGFKAVSDKYGLKYNPTWFSFLKSIDKIIKSKSSEFDSEKNKQSTIARSLRKEIKLLNELRVKIDAIREAWRNPTIHVGTKYDEDQAREIFDTARRFMEYVVANFSDKSVLR